MGLGLAIIGAMAALSGPAPATCPAGVPVQTITVTNQAHVNPFALAKVENAITDQSLQLRAAWGTPCAQFGPGGWPLDLRIGAGPWGAHYTQPLRILVYTGGLPYASWSTSLSHEILETLVDPSTVNEYGTGPSGGNIEPADPVEDRGYRIGGVYVSDFVLPAWYAGAHLGVCATVLTGYDCPGPLLAAADAPGPYDEMGVLTGPWQTAG